MGRRSVLMMLPTVAAVVVVGCGPTPGFVVGAEPEPLPEPTVDHRWEDLDDDRVRTWPRSARIEPGVDYRFTAYTHCGLDHAFDLDGSFWVLISEHDGPRHEVLDDPDDTGVATLLGDDTAVYRSSKGEEFRLHRIEGPIDIHLCD